MAAISDDVFAGARRRYVADPETTSCELGAKAVAALFESTGVGPEEIDCLLMYMTVPDHLSTNNACTLHDLSGLPRRCFTMPVDAACNSFIMQMAIADSMIRAGRIEKALLVQSCVTSRILDYNTPISAMLGDGATAVLVGKVPPGYGVLGHAHHTDGSLRDTLVVGRQGYKWYQCAPLTTYSANPRGAYRMFETVGDYGLETVHEALDEAGMTASDIDFYASHQGTAWFTQVTKTCFGLHDANTIELFPETANLSAASIPAVLATARARDLLHAGDAVLMHAGGSGITWSSMVLRWCEA